MPTTALHTYRYANTYTFDINDAALRNTERESSHISYVLYLIISKSVARQKSFVWNVRSIKRKFCVRFSDAIGNFSDHTTSPRSLHVNLNELDAESLKNEKGKQEREIKVN